MNCIHSVTGRKPAEFGGAAAGNGRKLKRPAGNVVYDGLSQIAEVNAAATRRLN
jgi:hypothetical protein